MNKKIKKIFLICLCLFLISSCATKEYSPNSLKNYSAKQILAAGNQALAKGEYSAAARYFESIDAIYPFDPEAEQGQLKVIYAYYKAEDFASAIAAADRYIHLYPEGKHTDYAYYMKGVVNFDKNRTLLQRLSPRNPEDLDILSLQDAFFNFSELIKRFPQSIYVKDAEKRMLYIRKLLAQHELHIAKFYFDRKAYVAAANRANEVVRHFERAPQVKDALKIMIKSYRALGLDKQANDAWRVFKLS